MPMTEWACGSPILINFLSSLCVDPKYLNLSASSNTFPFIHILVDSSWYGWRWLFFFCNRLPFSFLQLLSSVFRLDELFFTASHKIDITSKPQVAEWTPFDERRGVKVSCIISSRNILSGRSNRHPCHTLLYCMSEKFRTFPLSTTAHVVSSYNDQMTSISRLSMLRSFKTRRRPPWQARSNQTFS